MCRFFAYVSAFEPCLLEDVLITPDNAIAKQIHEHYLPGLLPNDPHDINSGKDRLVKLRNALYNLDGMGLAWYTSAREEFIDEVSGLRPVLYKSICPPRTDFNFTALCASTESNVVFAHLRAANTAKSAVTQTNCHPFAFGRHTIMHNGTVPNFINVKRPFSEYMDIETFEHVQGNTESEAMAGLYMTYLTGGKGKEAWEKDYSARDMRDALRKTVITLLQLQKQVDGDKFRPGSINLVVTDGNSLVAFRFRNHKTEEPPSLYYSTTAGTTLNRKYRGHEFAQAGSKPGKKHARHIIVSSEPTTFEEKKWTLIKRNHCIMVERDGYPEIEAIPYPDELNAEDPDASE